MKRVYAVSPYNHGINFKMQAYDAWINSGGEHMKSHYPPKILHGLFRRYKLPSLNKNKKIAQLRFVEPVTIELDTFPDYSRYEIIPLIWDCWPIYFEKTCQWFVKHNVKTAIFTSSQTADNMRRRFPEMNILTITEGINTSVFRNNYKKIKEKEIDLFEISTLRRSYFKKKYPIEYSKLCNISPTRSTKSDEDFRSVLFDTKVTIMFPRCDTRPQIAGNIETLTQRYWECMLSGMIMVGRAPKELIDLIGYNPVLDLNRENEIEHVEDIIKHAEDYQELVDKNRETALNMADWSLRIEKIRSFLSDSGYLL